MRRRSAEDRVAEIASITCRSVREKPRSVSGTISDPPFYIVLQVYFRAMRHSWIKVEYQIDSYQSISLQRS
jgi:hypothetical protein